MWNSQKKIIQIVDEYIADHQGKLSTKKKYLMREMFNVILFPGSDKRK
jgi:hypothetical protein